MFLKVHKLKVFIIAYNMFGELYFMTLRVQIQDIAFLLLQQYKCPVDVTDVIASVIAHQLK